MFYGEQQDGAGDPDGSNIHRQAVISFKYQEPGDQQEEGGHYKIPVTEKGHEFHKTGHARRYPGFYYAEAPVVQLFFIVQDNFIDDEGKNDDRSQEEEHFDAQAQ